LSSNIFGRIGFVLISGPIAASDWNTQFNEDGLPIKRYTEHKGGSVQQQWQSA
jgi:hypothetical protein